MDLALPLGELSKPQALTERAHAVPAVADVSGETSNFPPLLKPSPGRGKVARSAG